MSDPARARVLDVSGLPEGAPDHTAPLWWGNLMLLATHSMVFLLLIATWFAFRATTHPWPPIRAVGGHAMLHANPALLVPTATLLVLLLSCIPAAFAGRAAQRLDRRAVTRWLAAALALALAAVALRLFEFRSLPVRWDENAYGSLVWAILAMHFAHLVTLFLGGSTTLAWVAFRGFAPQRALVVRCSTVYWYWMAGVWVPLYVLVYLVPRLT